MHRRAMLLAALVLLAGCGRTAPAAPAVPEPVAASTAAPKPQTEQTGQTEENEQTGEETQMQLSINGQTVQVTWEQNEATAALQSIVADGPLTVTAEPYGGFEVVAALGHTLPGEDEQTVTAAGDIVLYNSDSIVVFHGSNSWAYTRLGHIENLDAEALCALFGTGDVELVLSAG